MLLPSLLKSGDQVYQKVIKQLYQKMLLLNLLITLIVITFNYYLLFVVGQADKSLGEPVGISCRFDDKRQLFPAFGVIP